jgi:hypothetical protein
MTAKAAASRSASYRARAPFSVHDVVHVTVTPCWHFLQTSTHWSSAFGSYDGWTSAAQTSIEPVVSSPLEQDWTANTRRKRTAPDFIRVNLADLESLFEAPAYTDSIRCVPQLGTVPQLAAAKPPFTDREVLPFRHDGQNTSAFPKLPAMSSPSRKNIHLSEIRNTWFNPPSRTHRRARRDRHERRARDAMDAVMPQDVRQGSVRSSRVVLIPRRWDQADRGQSIGDGG